MTPLDVIIPAFGHQDLLDRAVASALAIPTVRRVIVIDDGSQPPLGASMDGVRLIRQPNAGPSSARNRGLELVEAEQVVFLDADDVLLPGVAEASDLMTRLGAVAVVSGWIEVAPGEDVELGRVRQPPEEWIGATLPSRADVFRPLHVFKGSGIMLSRAAIDAGVRFDSELRIGEDREFLYRAAEVGPIGVCGDPVIGYTLHGEEGANLSSPRRFDRRVRDFDRVVRKHHAAETAPRFEAAARWLANQLAKRRADTETWNVLMTLCRDYGWKPSLKSRLRRWYRR